MLMRPHDSAVDHKPFQIGKEKLLAGDIPAGLGSEAGDDEEGHPSIDAVEEETMDGSS
jgi:hypothetical protein